MSILDTLKDKFNSTDEFSGYNKLRATQKTRTLRALGSSMFESHVIIIRKTTFINRTINIDWNESMVKRDKKR